ncbi:hypothetical protein HMPREF9062_2066 [Actinomyces sp. oral taxon 448 str. F0400]|nr:hypothetical protein HMPREF9062_2066 [Actinomyces sp. oral taxon 448 str. F0400]
MLCRPSRIRVPDAPWSLVRHEPGAPVPDCARSSYISPPRADEQRHRKASHSWS